MNGRVSFISVALIKCPRIFLLRLRKYVPVFWITWCSWYSCTKVIVHQQPPIRLHWDLPSLVLRIFQYECIDYHLLALREMINISLCGVSFREFCIFFFFFCSGKLIIIASEMKHSSRFICQIFYFITEFNKLVLRNEEVASLIVCSGLYQVNGPSG